jgi:hypothetical protein
MEKYSRTLAKNYWSDLPKQLLHVAEVLGVANAKAAGGYQQRGEDQQVPTSIIINILAFYCFLWLFTGLFTVLLPTAQFNLHRLYTLAFDCLNPAYLLPPKIADRLFYFLLRGAGGCAAGAYIRWEGWRGGWRGLTPYFPHTYSLVLNLLVVKTGQPKHRSNKAIKRAMKLWKKCFIASISLPALNASLFHCFILLP